MLLLLASLIVRKLFVDLIVVFTILATKCSLIFNTLMKRCPFLYMDEQCNLDMDTIEDKDVHLSYNFVLVSYAIWMWTLLKIKTSISHNNNIDIEVVNIVVECENLFSSEN